jgi:outer membrane murein-binding lipoprotein Lpp
MFLNFDIQREIMRIGVLLVSGLLLSGCVKTVEERNKEREASPEIQTIMPVIIEQCRLSAEGQNPAVSYAALQKHGFQKANLNSGYAIGLKTREEKTIFSAWDHIHVVFNPKHLFGEYKGCSITTNITDYVILLNLEVLKNFTKASYSVEVINKGVFSLKKGSTRISSMATITRSQGSSYLEISITKRN